jgi:hypothetical protein
MLLHKRTEQTRNTNLNKFIFKHGLNNTKYISYLKYFQDWCQNLHFYILREVNLFYGMQLQNEIILPETTRQVNSVTSMNIFGASLL